MLKTLMIVAYLMSHPTGNAGAPGAFSIISSAFVNAGIIPIVYTCHGRNISMPLSWKSIPRGTKSLALIIIDQDVPRNAWYHWAVYNIPPNTSGFTQDFKPLAPIKIAANSWGNEEYQGPCPPQGEHHYMIQLYALDKKLPDQLEMTTIRLREAMRNHIIATAQTMGRSVTATIQ